MSKAFLDAIATELDAAGVTGGATGWAAAKLQVPDVPNSVTVLPAPGLPPVHQALRRVLEPAFQIQVRGETGAPGDAYDKAVAAQVALDAAAIGDFRLIRATESEPLAMQPDEAGRPLWVFGLRAVET